MIKLLNGGAYVLNGTEIIPDTEETPAILKSRLGNVPSKEEARKQTIAYGFLRATILPAPWSSFRLNLTS